MQKQKYVFSGFFLFALIIFGAAAPANAEDVKITTYYPSPYGFYKALSSTDNTNLATDATAKVGIGTATPVSKLDIAGGNLNIPTTASSTVGVISQNGTPFIHSFGANNFFAGANAGNFTMTGDQNSGVGYSALISNTSGSNNTASGFQALDHNTTGNFNVASGFQSLFSNITGSNNVASGYEALMFNTTGSYNTAYGNLALNQNMVSQNTAFGSSALHGNITGQDNTAVGTDALLFNSTGQNNTATGYTALDRNITGSGNAAYGTGALYNTTGSENTALGSNALQNNANTTDNTGVGYSAGNTNVTGSSNTFIGAYTGTGSFSNLTNATAIGYRAEVDQSNSLILGGITGVNFGTSVKVGIGTNVPTNLLTLGSDDAAKPNGGTWKTTSDARVKTDIRPFTDGLGVVKQINPVWYKYNGKAGFKKDGKDQIGIIAQEIKDVAPYTISTYKTKLDPGDAEETELLQFNAHALTFALINAVKEQQKEIEELKKEITELNKKS